VLAYLFSGIGDWLYLFGTAIERNRRNSLRSIRKRLRRFFAGFFVVLKALGSSIWSGIKGIWIDVTMPFKKIRRSFKSLMVVIKSSEQRGAKYTLERVRLFFKYGWLWNKHLVGRLMNYVAPLVALVLCIVIISTMMNLNYALEVNYNGQTVGFIENESVYDSARKIIQNRMVSGDDGAIWSDDTVLRIAVVEPGAVATQDVMADSLLQASGSEIAQATGIYIGGTFYGATTAPDMLENQLNEMRAPYEQIAQQLGENAYARFARDVELKDAVYLIDQVVPFDNLMNEIASQSPQDIYYHAEVGESLEDIAAKNGITIDTLKALNPGLVDLTENGASLLVARGEPLLRVKTVQSVTEVVPVAYTTVTTRDSSRTGIFITQEGVAGERTITRELEYDSNGEIVSELIISDEVTKEPTPQLVLIGSNVSSGGSGGILAWPTGPYQRISRGWIPGVHQGIDIAGEYGTAILAAESGTVTLSAYTTVGYGHYVIIQHSSGMSTLYGHCSTLLVEQGQYVQRGELIALMGSTGNSTGNHLHFEVRINNVRVPTEDWLY
jgi:murein DD-endopeptidase MepM/ murein hydrolase activator NlpD